LKYLYEAVTASPSTGPYATMLGSFFNVKSYNITASSNQFLKTFLQLLASKWATLLAISDL